MTFGEFIEETSKLENYYEKEYTLEQRKIMYEEVKNIQVEKYRADVRQLLRNNKFLPKLADVLAVNKEIHINSNNNFKNIECKKCKGTGYSFYTKIIKNGDKEIKYEYAYLCDCGNAKQYRGWEHNDNEHKTNYYIPYKNEIEI